MSDSVSWNSYAFIHDENLPRYEYYMLVIDKTLGDQYLQLSELRLICNNTLEVPLVVSANPNKAIVALGTLQYDDSCFELVPSEDIYSDNIVPPPLVPSVPNEPSLQSYPLLHPRHVPNVPHP